MGLIYTNIQHDFRKKHNLTMNEYVLCDMVFFLSKDSGSKVPNWCYMTKENMGLEMSLSKQSIITLTKKLVTSGFLEKQEFSGFLRTTKKWESVYFTNGKESLPEVKKDSIFGKESLPDDGKESLLYNNTLDNNINKEKNEISLFHDLPKEPLKKEKPSKEKVLFFDSVWNNFENVKSYFISDKKLIEKYAYCDLAYYILRVDTWSENSQTKRTDRGWIMTLVDFIDQAKSKGEMRTIQKAKSKDQGHINY